MKYKYIHMDLLESGLKTNLYSVRTNSGNDGIGYIKWYSPWRQYCLFPRDDTVWNKGCLEDVNEFIQTLMDKRKKKGR